MDLLDEQRLSGATALAQTVASRLGTDDPELLAELRDGIWATMSPTLYESFVVRRGWTPARYQQWLRRAMQIPIETHPQEGP